MKLKWLRRYRKPANHTRAVRSQDAQICNYQDNYYGDQVCRLK